ncbi:MAG: mechanosensitive ion channel family protein [Pseudomonadota bacterium]
MRFLLIPAATLAFAGTAAAQIAQSLQSAEANENAAAAALEALEAAGATVIVVPETGAVAPAMIAAETPSLASQIGSIRMALEPVIANVPSVPGQLLNALYLAGNGNLGWLIPAALFTLFALLVGTVGFQLTSRSISKMVSAIGTPPPDTRAGKIGRALAVLARGWIATAAFFATGAISVILLEPRLSPERVTALIALGAITSYLVVRCVMTSVLAPNNPPLRLAPFNDRLAKGIFAAFLFAFFVSNIVAWLCFWFRYFPLAADVHKLLLMFSASFSMVRFLTVVVRFRTALTEVVRGSHPRPVALRRMATVLWPFLAVGYLLAAWVTTVAIIALDTRLVLGPVGAPVLGLVAAMIVNGILLIVLDRRVMPGIVNPAWADLYERLALGVSAVVGFAVLAGLWRVFDGPYGGLATNAIGLALAALVAWGAWQSVKVWVNARLAEEAADGPADGEGEGFGPGASRLATLLPIFRNVMFFAIASVLAMVCLASLGVNIGPLFAGAGVVGLAIGFGAQALIRDVFSGAFFLLDDAFRRGEYISVGDTQGMVEKISIRSFQLRHHEGALHTLPFGEIKQLTNFSRDWVIMKLPVRLTYDTDVEKVRKLVKKLGQEMAADPEIGPLLMEPPKSQGVVQMEDSAMIMRVKFKTKPGDQFLVRRHLFTRLRDVFSQNGIEFAHREVTVRVTDASDPAQRRQAALGAARAEAEAGAAGQASEFASAAG